MDKLPFRQVHLDFHTGDNMPEVGSMFSEKNFKEALTIGHISSITLFAKCHHGWAYYPSKINKMHPSLKTDLLGRQLKVCRELKVRTQIYISAGIDEHTSNEHPQFRNVVVGGNNTLLGSHFHPVCLNNDEYLDYLCCEVAEVMELYGSLTDGIFMDICTPTPCVCPSCIRSMLNMGLNPENPDDVNRHARTVYTKYTKRINETVAKYNPDMAVFHNCGNLPRDDRDWIFANTRHLELESLPTGGWGYDHFPMSAAYCRVLGREFSGMTGKFHKSWGEFGGYKHPNALKYETALSLALGAKCCVGDQLHPLGKFDIPTYRLIGTAYADVEKKEEWCKDVHAVSDIAIYTTYTATTANSCPDIGANRILLEGKYLYDIIDRYCDLNAYKLIVFPDTVRFDKELSDRVCEYIGNGGRILLSGVSGVVDGDFFTDFGVKFRGENQIDATYLLPNYEMEGNGIASYLMYRRGYSVEISESVEVMAQLQNSYFNRSFRNFCSHANTPFNPDDLHPGAVISGDGKIGYIAWNIFDEYRVHGAYHQKRAVCDMIDRLLGTSKTMITNLPSNGVATLMYQPKENRYINHLLYAVTKQRGCVEVIEDAIPLYDVKVRIRLPDASDVKGVYTAPEKLPLNFEFRDGILEYTYPSFTLHGMAVIQL